MSEPRPTTSGKTVSDEFVFGAMTSDEEDSDTEEYDRLRAKRIRWIRFLLNNAIGKKLLDLREKYPTFSNPQLEAFCELLADMVDDYENQKGLEETRIEHYLGIINRSYATEVEESDLDEIMQQTLVRYPEEEEGSEEGSEEDSEKEERELTVIEMVLFSYIKFKVDKLTGRNLLTETAHAKSFSHTFELENRILEQLSILLMQETLNRLSGQADPNRKSFEHESKNLLDQINRKYRLELTQSHLDTIIDHALILKPGIYKTYKPLSIASFEVIDQHMEYIKPFIDACAKFKDPMTQLVMTCEMDADDGEFEQDFTKLPKGKQYGIVYDRVIDYARYELDRLSDTGQHLTMHSDGHVYWKNETEGPLAFLLKQIENEIHKDMSRRIELQLVKMKHQIPPPRLKRISQQLIESVFNYVVGARKFYIPDDTNYAVQFSISNVQGIIEETVKLQYIFAREPDKVTSVKLENMKQLVRPQFINVARNEEHRLEAVMASLVTDTPVTTRRPPRKEKQRPANKTEPQWDLEDKWSINSTPAQSLLRKQIKLYVQKLMLTTFDSNLSISEFEAKHKREVERLFDEPPNPPGYAYDYFKEYYEGVKKAKSSAWLHEIYRANVNEEQIQEYWDNKEEQVKNTHTKNWNKLQKMATYKRNLSLKPDQQHKSHKESVARHKLIAHAVPGTSLDEIYSRDYPVALTMDVPIRDITVDMEELKENPTLNEIQRDNNWFKSAEKNVNDYQTQVAMIKRYETKLSPEAKAESIRQSELRFEKEQERKALSTKRLPPPRGYRWNIHKQQRLRSCLKVHPPMM